jgi:hypothetical protein
MRRKKNGSADIRRCEEERKELDIKLKTKIVGRKRRLETFYSRTTQSRNNIRRRRRRYNFNINIHQIKYEHFCHLSQHYGFDLHAKDIVLALIGFHFQTNNTTPDLVYAAKKSTHCFVTRSWRVVPSLLTQPKHLFSISFSLQFQSTIAEFVTTHLTPLHDPILAYPITNSAVRIAAGYRLDG